MAKKIWTVYYEPTGEKWYFLDKKLAIKTVKALENFDKKHLYKYASYIELDYEFIREKVIFEP